MKYPCKIPSSCAIRSGTGFDEAIERLVPLGSPAASSKISVALHYLIETGSSIQNMRKKEGVRESSKGGYKTAPWQSKGNNILAT